MIDDDFFWSGWNQAIGIGSTSSNYVFGYQSTNGSHRGTIKANGAASDVGGRATEEADYTIVCDAKTGC